MDLSDEPESGETKKGSLQNKIGSSAVDQQVRNAFILDTSTLPTTQTPDERQVEVGSTGQSKKV
jgi:hypothetical protein